MGRAVTGLAEGRAAKAIAGRGRPNDEGEANAPPHHIHSAADDRRGAGGRRRRRAGDAFDSRRQRHPADPLPVPDRRRQNGTAYNATINWATDQSQTHRLRDLRAGRASSPTPHTGRTAARPRSRSTACPSISGRPSSRACCRGPRTPTACCSATRPRPAGPDASPTFTTPPPPGATTPFSFAVFGDWGATDSTGTNPDQANLMTQIAASGASFALSTGDIGLFRRKPDQLRRPLPDGRQHLRRSSGRPSTSWSGTASRCSPRPATMASTPPS